MLSQLGVLYVLRDVDATRPPLADLRSSGLRVLWRCNEMTPDKFLLFQQSFQKGDGLFPNEDGVFGYPGFVFKAGAVAADRDGFVSVLEFNSNKGIGALRQSSVVPAVKIHALHLEETLAPAPRLWQPRLLRAVQERQAGLLLVRLSPRWTDEQKLLFLADLGSQFKSHGYSWGAVEFPFSRGSSGPVKSGLALALAVAGPLAIVIIAASAAKKNPLAAYALAGVFCIAVGVAVHALAFRAEALVGLAEFRGVKVALLGPLVLLAAILVSAEQWREWGRTSPTWADIGLVGLMLIGFGGFLVMRSGNFPLIPVRPEERILRDGLERLFVARPRFKEFLLAQPLLLYGLYRIKESSWLGPRSAIDALVLVAGSLAVVSVINTFSHLHVPLLAGVIRTVHGLWLGALVFFAVRFLVAMLRGRRSVL